MKDSRRDLDRIPKEKLTAYERWELPLLDAAGNEIAQAEERNVKPLTAADIEEIRRAAKEDGLEEGRKEGHDAGYQAGLEKGQQEGYAAGLEQGREVGEKQALEDTHKRVDEGLGRLDALLSELLVPIERHEDELETALVNLTTALSRAVLYRELSLDSSQISAVVKRALAALPSTTENVRLHIHPDDYQWVAEVAERYEAKASIVEDAAIMRGGCKAETRHSLVDFTIEKRFQKAVQDMLSQELDGDPASNSEELDTLMDDLTEFHRDVLDPDKPEGDPDDGKAG